MHLDNFPCGWDFADWGKASLLIHILLLFSLFGVASSYRNQKVFVPNTIIAVQKFMARDIMSSLMPHYLLPAQFQ